MIDQSHPCFKYLPVERVIYLLQQVPPGSLIHANQVQNLSVFDGDKLIAIVDFFGEGEIDTVDQKTYRSPGADLPA